MEYISKYSKLAAPLTTLPSSAVVFKWTPEINHAFEALKEAFRNPSQLSRPDPDLPFVLQTDASAVDVGAVLKQIGPNGNQRIISYSRAKFSETENIFLSELRFTIQYCRGKDNELPDVLSRQADPGELSPVEPNLERMVPPGMEVPTVTLQIFCNSKNHLLTCGSSRWHYVISYETYVVYVFIAEDSLGAPWSDNIK